jgi:hypothetical protein
MQLPSSYTTAFTNGKSVDADKIAGTPGSEVFPEDLMVKFGPNCDDDMNDVSLRAVCLFLLSFYPVHPGLSS